MEPVRDTASEARAIQLETLRNVGPAQRLRIATELTDDVLRNSLVPEPRSEIATRRLADTTDPSARLIHDAGCRTCGPRCRRAPAERRGPMLIA